MKYRILLSEGSLEAAMDSLRRFKEPRLLSDAVTNVENTYFFSLACVWRVIGGY